MSDRMDNGQRALVNLPLKVVTDVHCSGSDTFMRRPFDSRDPKVGSRGLEATGSRRKSDDQNSPEDSDWNEICTRMTTEIDSQSGPFSESKTIPRRAWHCYRRYSASLVAGSISASAFLSPIIMVFLPLQQPTTPTDNTSVTNPSQLCNPECEGLLISMSVKLIILLIGTWGLFISPPRASLPRVSVFRTLVLFSVFLLSLSYWLFYGVRIVKPGVKDYRVIVRFSSSLVDALIFVHYLAVILLRIRSTSGQYVVKIVRSPDGESRSYTVGQMSIQSLAVSCLQYYYRDFPVYYPSCLGRKHFRRKSKTSSSESEYKVYDVDDRDTSADVIRTSGINDQPENSASGAADSEASSEVLRRRPTEELAREWQSKLDQRKLKLISATEEAFSRIRTSYTLDEGVDVDEATEIVFALISRPLHRYLRHLGAHPPSPNGKRAILDRISLCISHEMSARAFLEHYFRPTLAVLAGTDPEGADWTLVCDKLPNAAVEGSTTFEVRRGTVHLLASVREVPYLNLKESTGGTRNARFVLLASDERAELKL